MIIKKTYKYILTLIMLVGFFVGKSNLPIQAKPKPIPMPTTSYDTIRSKLSPSSTNTIQMIVVNPGTGFIGCETSTVAHMPGDSGREYIFSPVVATVLSDTGRIHILSTDNKCWWVPFDNTDAPFSIGGAGSSSFRIISCNCSDGGCTLYYFPPAMCCDEHPDCHDGCGISFSLANGGDRHGSGAIMYADSIQYNGVIYR